MLYTIKNKKILKNKFSLNDKETTNCLTFCESFDPTTCGWMIQRLENKQNQYSLFSMSTYTYKSNDVANTFLDLATLDPVSPIVNAIESGYKYPFGLTFVEPIFSAESTTNFISMQQLADETNAWTILPADHNALIPFFKNGTKETTIPRDNDGFIEFDKLTTEIDYSIIRQTCSNSNDCGSGNDLGSNEKYHKFGKCGKQICEEGLCRTGVQYGEFCDFLKATKGTAGFGNEEAECGKDANGDQLYCMLTANLDRLNACRYKINSQEDGGFCGRTQECKGYHRQFKNAWCTGGDDKLKIGAGICGRYPGGEKHNSFTAGYALNHRCKSGKAAGGYCLYEKPLPCDKNCGIRNKCFDDNHCGDTAFCKPSITGLEKYCRKQITGGGEHGLGIVGYEKTKACTSGWAAGGFCLYNNPETCTKNNISDCKGVNKCGDSYHCKKDDGENEETTCVSTPGQALRDIAGKQY